MTNVSGVGSPTNIPGTYPANATGVAKTTKDIAEYCYDTQRPNIDKTYNYLTSEDPSYKLPVIGCIVSALSIIAIRILQKRP